MKEQGINVLILPENNPEEIKGILVPKTASKMNSIGLVIRCGSGCIEVKDGDRVIYSPKSGSIIPIKGVDHHYVSEKDIQYMYGKD